jgi:hypothetical protein
MKRLLIYLTLYWMGILLSQAQPESTTPYSLHWNRGLIHFKSGDSIACTLRYNHSDSHGVLQVIENDNIITLLPQDVLSFSFFDNQRKRQRKFVSLTTTTDSPQFFFMENLYSDSRFAIVNHRTMDVPYGYMHYTRLISKPVPMNKKYILDAGTGTMLPLSRENALRLMNTKRNEVSAYIQSHRLKFKKTADYIHLFEYHNSL